MAVLLTVVLVGGAGAVALTLRPDGTPSPQDCVAAWNTPSNHANQAAIADWHRAAVYGWLAKETYPGCGVILVQRVGGPWISYAREIPDGAWARESGLRWGRDSPEGPGARNADNATVTASGRLVLD